MVNKNILEIKKERERERNYPLPMSATLYSALFTSQK
jgi:hypothetical protein